MSKSLLYFALIFIAVAASIFFLHDYVLATNNLSLSFPLDQMYVFHVLFSIILVVTIYILGKKVKFQEQTGFLYLVSVFLKAIVFCFVFMPYIFSGQEFSKMEAASLLAPVFLALFFEVFFLYKLLKTKA